MRRDLHRLAQHRDAAVDGDAAARGRKLAGQQAQQRRFADAVAPDEAGAFALEMEIETRKDGAAVRRGPAEVGAGDRWRGGGDDHGLFLRTGGAAVGRREWGRVGREWVRTGRAAWWADDL